MKVFDQESSWLKIGQVFGRLEIVGSEFLPNKSGRRVTAKCQCGAVKDFRSEHIRNGRTTSCGCFHDEVRLTATKTHGNREHPLYVVWANMKNRCYNENVRAYKDYGGRGITVCSEWVTGFTSFFDWAIQNGWAKSLELDRADNNGGYSPTNCRFVTAVINARNKRNNRIIDAFGESKTLIEWAEDPCCVVKRNTIAARIKNGWDVESAIATPHLQPATK